MGEAAKTWQPYAVHHGDGSLPRALLKSIPGAPGRSSPSATNVRIIITHTKNKPNDGLNIKDAFTDQTHSQRRTEGEHQPDVQRTTSRYL